MKKKFLALAVLFGIITVPLSVQAAAVEKGYLTVNTSANTEIAPDTAEISFAVKTFDNKSMQKATQSNKEISDKLYLVLSDLLNPSNVDYVKTSSYSASPVYIYSNGKRSLDKYEVSNRVIVHTKSIENLGKMIDKAIESGATNVDSLTFSASSSEKQCNDLLGIASKKAYVRAEVIAKNLASGLDGVRSIDTSCSADNHSVPKMYLARNMMADSASGSSAQPETAIAGGTIKINANVNASFFVK